MTNVADTPILGLPHWRHCHYDDTGSTNMDCLTAARAGDKGDLWITAGRQFSGRGRLGRQWVSEPGNLYASALLLDAAPMNLISTLPFAAALALHSTFSQISNLGADRIKIKWPNDILIDGAKISGMLIESEVMRNGIHAVACGFGVNTAHHPKATHYPTTDLKMLGVSCQPQGFFRELAINFAAILDIWNRGKGFTKIRTEWLRHAKGVGETITVNLPTERLEGMFVDIDFQGCLVFSGPMGEERIISAGDIFFPAYKGN